MESNGGPFLWINDLKVKMEYSHGVTSTILGVNIHSDDWLCNQVKEKNKLILFLLTLLSVE